MRTFVMIFLMVLAGLSLYAQGITKKTERHGARLKAALSLTDEEWNEFRQINEQFKAEQSRLRTDTAMTRAAIQEERKKLMEKRDAGLEKILTKEQGAKWDSLRKVEHKRAMTHRNRTSHREKMKEAVGLSDEQMKKIMEINRSMGADFKALRTDSVMTRESRGQAIREIMQARNEKIKNVLTKKQYEKFLEFESENRQLHRKHGRQHGARHPAGRGRN